MHLYLVRHGEYAADEVGDEILCQGLTERGKEQAAQTGDMLRSLVPASSPLKVVSSDFKRASDTARVIAERLELTAAHGTVSALREISDQHPHDRLRPATQVERFFLGLCQAEPADSTTICVCHANIIRYALVVLAELSRDEWEELELTYCSVSGLRVDAEGTAQVLFVGAGPDHRTRAPRDA
jgi:serine/threonine-protein phosphatase PGAM5